MKRFLWVVALACSICLNANKSFADGSTAIVDNIQAMNDFVELSGVSRDDGRKLFDELGCSPYEGMQKYHAFVWGSLAAVADSRMAMEIGNKSMPSVSKSTKNLSKVFEEKFTLASDKFLDATGRSFAIASKKVGIYDRMVANFKQLNPFRGGKTGAHGFVGEILTVKDMELAGKNVQWVNDNGAADLIVGKGKQYQLKFKNIVPLKDLTNVRYSGQVLGVPSDYGNFTQLKDTAKSLGKKVVKVGPTNVEAKTIAWLRKLETYAPGGRELNAVVNIYRFAGVTKTGLQLGADVGGNAFDVGKQLTNGLGTNITTNGGKVCLRLSNVAWRSGMRGALGGGAAGGVIGGVTNLYYVVKYGKDISDAIVDTAVDVGIGAASGLAIEGVLGVMAATETGAAVIASVGGVLAPVVAVVPVVMPFVIVSGTCYFLYDLMLG